MKCSCYKGDWDGPATFNLVEDENCIPLGIGPENKNLDQCRQLCRERERCNAINFNDETFACHYGSCDFPFQLQSWDYGPNRGYALIAGMRVDIRAVRGIKNDII